MLFHSPRLVSSASRRRLLLAGVGFASVALATVAAPARAEAPLTTPVTVGSTLPARTLPDQHDKAVTIDATTRWVVLAADKKTTDWVNPVMATRGAAALEQAGGVYVADISAMPSMITKMFALPALREVPIPIGLARDAKLLADVPRQKGLATVLKLQRLTVQQVVFAADAAALKAALTP